MVTAKVSTTDMYSLAPLEVRERTAMDAVLLWLPKEKCMAKSPVGHKYYICLTFQQKDLKILLAGQAALQMSQISRLCVITFMSY